MPLNFLRAIIESDLAGGTIDDRPYGGSPGDAAHHAAGSIDPARLRTRFPPEPNGYLHIGHAKSICLNFGLARDYGGICHLRLDDTNPSNETEEFVDGIIDAVKWLGYDWEAYGTRYLYHASDYFDFMVRAAEALIADGLAYVDEQTAEQVRAGRGDFTTPGTDSPFRDRASHENLSRFRAMQAGDVPDRAAILRARIEMSSPNLNLRDPALYRVRHAVHHRTGKRWCIYPMYTYAHPIEDALERITHSLSTLEFEDQRPFYDWLLNNLARLGLLAHPLPRQIEFGRLNLTTVLTSKRKLKSLVDEGIVSGWDDPRLPTIVGMRRRGYTPRSIRTMSEATGASKTNVWVDYSVLDIALRNDLEGTAPRVMAVLDPMRLKITNWADLFGSKEYLPCQAPVHPHRPNMGMRAFSLGRELWIDRSDFEPVPPEGFRRLFPGNRV